MFDEEPDADPHGECAAEIQRLEARLKELEREVEDLQRLPQPLQGFIPQTYGEAIEAGWIRHGECPSHEWDNRTSAGNARWMLERFLATPRRTAAPEATSVSANVAPKTTVSFAVNAYDANFAGYGDDRSRRDFKSAEEAIAYAKSIPLNYCATAWKTIAPEPIRVKLFDYKESALPSPKSSGK
jgi:hypothetical protein